MYGQRVSNQCVDYPNTASGANTSSRDRWCARWYLAKARLSRLRLARINEGDECQQRPYNYVCINSIILPSALLSIERPITPNDALLAQSKICRCLVKYVGLQAPASFSGSGTSNWVAATCSSTTSSPAEDTGC